MTNFANKYENNFEYDFDAIAQEIDRDDAIMTPELSGMVFEHINKAVAENHAAVVAAATVFIRKDYINTRQLGAQATAYGSSTDDVLLQVTVRVPRSFVAEVEALATSNREAAEDAALAAEKAELDAQIEAHNAKVAELAAKRAKLS